MKHSTSADKGSDGPMQMDINAVAICMWNLKRFYTIILQQIERKQKNKEHPPFGLQVSLSAETLVKGRAKKAEKVPCLNRLSLSDSMLPQKLMTSEKTMLNHMELNIDSVIGDIASNNLSPLKKSGKFRSEGAVEMACREWMKTSHKTASNHTSSQDTDSHSTSFWKRQRKSLCDHLRSLVSCCMRQDVESEISLDVQLSEDVEQSNECFNKGQELRHTNLLYSTPVPFLRSASTVW